MRRSGATDDEAMPGKAAEEVAGKAPTPRRRAPVLGLMSGWPGASPRNEAERLAEEEAVEASFDNLPV